MNPTPVLVNEHFLGLLFGPTGSDNWLFQWALPTCIFPIPMFVPDGNDAGLAAIASVAAISQRYPDTGSG